MSTRQGIRQRFLRETYTGIVSTETGGSATTLVDSSYTDSGADSASGVGLWLYRPAAAAADQVRRSTAYTVASGTFTHGGPNYAVSPASSTYEIHFFMDPRELNQCLNRALSRCWYRTLTPLSLITDYDMETSGTTNWTASNATLSKVTGVTGFNGKQALQVLSTSATGTATSVAVGAFPSTNWYMQALAHVSSGDSGIILRAIDQDGTTIDSVTLAEASSDNAILGTVALAKSFIVGSGVTSIRLRLIVSDDATTTRWDDVILHRIGSNRLPLPTWITSENQIEQIFTQRYTHVVPGTTDVMAADFIEKGDLINWHLDLDGNTEGNQATIVLDGYHLTSSPVYIYANRPYPSLSDETTTVSGVDEDLVVAALKLEFYQTLDSRPWSKGQYQNQLQKARADFMALSRYHTPRIIRPITAWW